MRKIKHTGLVIAGSFKQLDYFLLAPGRNELLQTRVLYNKTCFSFALKFRTRSFNAQKIFKV